MRTVDDGEHRRAIAVEVPLPEECSMQADPRLAPRPAQRSVLPLVIGAALLALGAGGAWWWSTRDAATPASVVVADAPLPTVEAPSGPAPIQHPIEQAPAAAAAAPPEVLPLLGDSDALVFEALAGLLADDRWRALVAGDFLIQRFVATVDNLPRRKLAPHLLPVRTASGTLVVEGEGESAAIAAANAARYDAHLAVLRAVDADKLVALYIRLYPLVQQAYREVGNPDGYFNDRLVEAIDLLVGAPQPAAPVRLVRPKVFWEYADPALEQASAGEKLMIRIGPAHASSVREKLTVVRALLVAAPAAPAAPPSP
jgi:hypothetical protein